jgi:folate-binding protein YgfZ
MTVLDRDLVTVTGPDTFSFLQSLVSQDVDGMADGEVRRSLLLTPKGKVTSVFRLVRVDAETAWLDLEAGHGDELRDSLTRFKLRVKAELGSPGEPWGMVPLRGGGDVPNAGRAPDGCVAIPVDGGVDVIGPRAALAAVDGTGALDADGYERARIEAGIPKLGAELDESTIPQEAYLDVDAVSFTKGCFLGQELVARIDSRGHVNRLLRRLRAADAAVAFAPGTEVTVDGKPVGTVTSSVPGVALGYVRREVDPATAVAVAGETATVEPVTAET